MALQRNVNLEGTTISVAAFITWNIALFGWYRMCYSIILINTQFRNVAQGVLWSILWAASLFL